MIDPAIKNRAVKLSVIACLALTALLLLAFFVFIPTGDKTVLGLLASASMMFVGISLLIMGVYIFVKNIRTYKTDGTSFGAKLYGSSHRDTGLMSFIINQSLNFILILTGSYIVYLMVDLILRILMY